MHVLLDIAGIYLYFIAIYCIYCVSIYSMEFKPLSQEPRENVRQEQELLRNRIALLLHRNEAMVPGHSWAVYSLNNDDEGALINASDPQVLVSYRPGGGNKWRRNVFAPMVRIVTQQYFCADTEPSPVLTSDFLLSPDNYCIYNQQISSDIKRKNDYTSPPWYQLDENENLKVDIDEYPTVIRLHARVGRLRRERTLFPYGDPKTIPGQLAALHHANSIYDQVKDLPPTAHSRVSSRRK